MRTRIWIVVLVLWPANGWSAPAVAPGGTIDSTRTGLIDSTRTAPIDTMAAEAPVDTIITVPNKGAAPEATRVPLSAAAPVDSARHHSPWATLAVPGDTLVLARTEVERSGAHFPLEILAQLPGAGALEGSGTAPDGAMSLAGSYASCAITSDGWPVRLPRLEGRDLSRLLLDRLGPGVTLIPLASPGEVRLSGDAGSGFDSPRLRFTPAEPTSDSSRSRVAIYNGGSLTGGGLVFSDRRGRFGYDFGIDNTEAGSSGGVSDLSTRLAIIDADVVTSWGRAFMSLRGTEAATQWKNGRRVRHDDQGAALGAMGGDPRAPAWSLRIQALDDRLSGSEFLGRDFRRKQGQIDARWWPRSLRPFWVHAVAERDWLDVRHPGGAYRPRVNRGQIEGGGEVAAGSIGRVHLLGSLMTSDRHPARFGGRIAGEARLSPTFGLGAGAGRVYRPPTLDQEVLVPGNPPAEPERQDAAEVWLAQRAPFGLGLLVAHRRLAHQPAIVGEDTEEPWPRFEFESSTRKHWEVRSTLSTPEGPFGLAGGLWGSRFFADGDSLSLLAFVPEAVARAFITMRFDWLGGDLVVRPRLDTILVGKYRDFAGQRVSGHGRLDATIVAIIGDQLDLELRVRNALDRRYPLALIDPETDQLLLDGGRLILVGLRWRLMS